MGNILKRHGIPPAPERKTIMTWREFIRIHLDVLGATDFFTSEVGKWLGLVIHGLFFFIPVGRCRWNPLLKGLAPSGPIGFGNGLRPTPSVEFIRHDRSEPFPPPQR